MLFRRLQLALLTLLLTASPLAAQSLKNAGNWAEWETISPEGEEFTVTMPKNPTTETIKFAYHKFELNTRLYLASSSTGPIVAVTSFSGIKSNPAEYTEFARFNSYIDAFKDYFPPKVRTKDTAVTKLTLVSSMPFHGNTGRSYKIAIGELSGSLQAYVTRKRFYAIVSLNTKKDDALENKFLSSFVLPERGPDPPKNVAANSEQPASEVAPEVSPDGRPQPQANQAKPEGDTGNTEQAAPADPNAANNTTTNTDANASNQQTPQSNQSTQKKGPVQGGVLNGKAIYLPMPEMPAGEANGVVLVAVLVDEQGTVIDARAVSGPAHLHAAAVAAARLARFSPTLLMGEPVRVTGTLSYSFVRAN
jgi:hypothetical protein